MSHRRFFARRWSLLNPATMFSALVRGRNRWQRRHRHERKWEAVDAGEHLVGNHVEFLEDRTLLSAINWVNRGMGSDNFDAAFGAGAPADSARAVIDAAIDAWERVVTNFNHDAGIGPPDIDVTVSMNLGNTGAGASAGTTFGADGKPITGNIQIGINDPDGDGNPNWFVDPTPNDNSEFLGAINNAFAGNATGGGPAAGLGDLYTVMALEMAHVMGLTTSGGGGLFQSGGFNTDTGIADDAEGGGVGNFWLFQGPNINALLTGNNGGAGGSDFGAPVHTAGPRAGNAPINFGGVTVYGANDTGNAVYEFGRRYLVDNRTANVLADAFGYEIVEPETFGTFYAVLNETTGLLTVRGGADNTIINNVNQGASDDFVTITRDGDNLVVSVDVGVDVPGQGRGTNPLDQQDAFVMVFDAGKVTSLSIMTFDGNDSIVIGDNVNLTATIDAGDGNDFIQGGDVTIFGGGGNDTLIGTAGSDSLDGGGGNDEIHGLGGDDTLIGGTGNDDIYAGTGPALVFDGTGNDLVDFSQTPGAIVYTSQGGNDTVIGSAFNDTIMDGDAMGDVLIGGAGDDTLTGGGGGDRIEGGAGLDSIVGNAGNDTLLGGSERDTLVGGAGNDIVDGGDDPDLFIFDGQANADDNIFIESLSQHPVFSTTSGAVVEIDNNANGEQDVIGDIEELFVQLNGAAATDAVTVDSLIGTEVEVLTLEANFGGADTVTINGTDAAENIEIIEDPTNAVLEQVLGLGPQINLVGYVLADDTLTVNGNGGDDVIKADPTLADNINIVLNGGAGNDFLSGDVTINGGAGNDTLVGSPGNDSLTGNDGDDVFIGNGGTDTINGGNGGDIVSVPGTAGNDTITLSHNVGGDLVVNINGTITTYVDTGIEEIFVDGRDGDDRVLIDITNGTLDYLIHYDGGEGSDDLQVFGDAAVDPDEVIYTVGQEIDEGRIRYEDAQNAALMLIDFVNLEPVNLLAVVPTLTVNATNANNAINYQNGRFDPGDNVSHGLISIDGFEVLFFEDKTNLVINGLAGDDTINLNNPNTPTGLTNITVNGGDPTAGSDTVIVNNTEDGTDITVDTLSAHGAVVTGAQPVAVTVTGAEHLTINGQGEEDDLMIETPAGDDLINLFPGIDATQGQIRIREFAASSYLPIDYVEFDVNAELELNDAGAIRDDTLVVFGTNAGDEFDVDDLGEVELDELGANAFRLLRLQTAGVDSLVLKALEGDDEIRVEGDHPFGSIAVEGGDPDSGSDVLTFVGSGVGAVTVDLLAKTITEFGFGAVSYAGIESIDIIANAALTVSGTGDNDVFDVTPLNDDHDGRFLHNFSPNTAFTYLSATSVTFNDGPGGVDTIRIFGDEAADVVTSNADTVTVDGSDVTIGNGIERFELHTLAGNDNIDLDLTLSPLAKVVDAGDGNDTVNLSGAVDATIFGGLGDDLIVGTGIADLIFGGSGNDTINAFGGNDTVFGGTGNDRIDGGTGNDNLFGDEDSDIFIWNPGDGSDLVEGGTADSDSLEFFGTAGNDTFVLQTDPIEDTRVDLLFGPVNMDIAGVEEVLVNDGGGLVDVLTVFDLHQTDVQVVEFDTGAQGDIETLSVHGRGTADDIVVSRSNAAFADAFVQGLRYDVNFVNSGANDTLIVLGNDGNDRIEANVPAGTIGIRLEGGDGDDFLSADATLIGGAGNDFLEGGAGNDSLDGGAGDDTFRGRGGTDTIVGGTGGDTILVLGSDQTETITVDELGGGDLMVTELAGTLVTTYTDAGALGIDGTSVENIRIEAGTGLDTFNVDPLTNAAYLVLGGSPIGELQQSNGDILNVIVPAATAFTFLPGPEPDSGTFAVTGFAPIAFDEIEHFQVNGVTYILPDEFDDPDLIFPGNDTIADATVLGSLPKITLRDLTLHDTGVGINEDFFKITAQDTGKLIINAFFTHADGNVDIEVQDMDGDVVFTSFGNMAQSFSLTDNEQIIIPVVSQEMYFLRVFSADGSPTTYDLEIENFAAPVPAAIHLDPSSDTGMMANDQITKDATPRFIIQADLQDFFNMGIDVLSPAEALANLANPVANPWPGVAVEVQIISTTTGLVHDAPVGGLDISGFASQIGVSNILFEFTPTNPLPDDFYFVTAAVRVFDGQNQPAAVGENGRTQKSEPLWLTIDRSAPKGMVLQNFVADLTGDQEAPGAPTFGPIVTFAGGDARFWLSPDQSRLEMVIELAGLDLDGLQTPAFAGDDVTNLHIHRGAPGVNGPVVFGLIGPNSDLNGDLVIDAVNGRISSGWDLNEGNGTTLAAELANLLAGNLYVNVHTTTNPAGEIRGQILPDGGQLKLVQSSDTGMSLLDRVTSKMAPAFVFKGEANAKARIFAKNTKTGIENLVGQGVVGSDWTDGVGDDGFGIGEITVEPMADGSYEMFIEFEDLAGNVTRGFVFMAMDLPAAIPDNDVAGVQVPINVQHLFGNVMDLDVQVDIDHPDLSQLQIQLRHEDSGTIVTLLNFGDAAGANFTGTVFDDEAGMPIGAGVAPYSGRFTPAMPLTAFDGLDPNSQWTLIVTDNMAGQVGTVENFKLCIKTDRGLPIVIDTVAPNTPYLDLVAASDSGRHDEDNVTNDNTPTMTLTSEDPNGQFAEMLFTDNLKFRVFDRFEGQAEFLLYDSAKDGPVDAINTIGDFFTASELIIETLPEQYFALFGTNVPAVIMQGGMGVLADGVHNLKLEVEDRAGNISHDFLLTITVDTVAPGNFIFGIFPPDDSGVDGFEFTIVDRITNDTTPNIHGLAEANSIVRLYADGISNDMIDLPTLFTLTMAEPLDGNDAFPNGQYLDQWLRDLNDPIFFPTRDGLREILATSEDLAGNVGNPHAIDIFIDTQGPRVNDPDGPGPVQAIQSLTRDFNGNLNANPFFNLFDIKPSAGPTPRTDAILINIIDFPIRELVNNPGILGGPDFLYPALIKELAETPGFFSVVGDRVGEVVITNITVTNVVVDGQAATATVLLEFSKPLTDDRYTLTISEDLTDPVGNMFDGESNANEPNDGPTFPSGNGIAGGDFVARFTVDSAPEPAAVSQSAIRVDANGNLMFDTTVDGEVNGDLAFAFGIESDAHFTGQFAPNAFAVVNGFDRIGAYGLINGVYRFLLDFNDNGQVDAGETIISNLQINATPIAGNFDLNPVNGDEIGLFDGVNWYLDINGDNVLDVTINGVLRGLPIVGDFDGDSFDDLATYQPDNDLFQFDLAFNGFGGFDAMLNFGVPGVTERPFAGDYNLDGIDDIGIAGVNQDAAVDSVLEWYVIISDRGFNNINVAPGSILPLFHTFSPAPVGRDLFFEFGREGAVPLFANFDPPLSEDGPDDATNVAAGEIATLIGDFDGDGLDDVAALDDQGIWHVALSTGEVLTTTPWAAWSSPSLFTDLDVGDVDGDGRDDIVALSDAGNVWVGMSRDGYFDTQLWSQWSAGEWWSHLEIADFNGDGRDDVAAISVFGDWYTGISTGFGFSTMLWSDWADIDVWAHIDVGDFNGDGYADVLGFGHNGSVWVGTSTGVGFSTLLWSNWSKSDAWAHLGVGDFNGDGRDDFFGLGNNGALFVGTSIPGWGFGATLWDQWSDSSTWAQLDVGDFNGDGYDDILAIGGNDMWFVGTSTGSSFGTWLWGDTTGNADPTRVHVGDFNGDGRTDVALLDETDGWWIGTSNDLEFEFDQWAWWLLEEEDNETDFDSPYAENQTDLSILDDYYSELEKQNSEEI